LCDHGERYAETLFDPNWLARQGVECSAWDVALRAVQCDGQWRPPC